MTDRTIGLTGKARSGKSTVAEILRRDHGFTVVSFADTLRDMALAIDPLIQAPITGQVWRLSEVVKWGGWERAKDIYPEVRRFLQRLGTEGVRDHLDQDAWVRAWSVKVGCISDAGDVVAADVRFPNEAAAVIRGFGGEVWRIERPDLVDPSRAAGHVSEAGIPDHLITLTIVNDGSLDDLASAVADALAKHPPIAGAA